MSGPLPEDMFAGIAFEGIGPEGDVSGQSHSGGWLICTSGVRDIIDTVESRSGWKPEPYLVISSLKGTSTLLEFFTGEVRWSGYSVRIQATDRMSERFLYEQRRAQTVLQERITPSAATLKLDDATLANTIIYIDDETIELGTATGTTGGVTTYNVTTRGKYQSTEIAHEKEANVFTETPYWEGRRVKLITGEQVQVAGQTTVDFTQRGTFTLQAPPTQDQGHLIFTLNEAGAGVSSVKGGRRDRTVRKGRLRVGIFGIVGIPLYESKIRKGDAGAPSDADHFDTALQIGDEMVFPFRGVYDTSGALTEHESLEARRPAKPILRKAYKRDDISDEDLAFPERPITEDHVYEVFAVDRFRDLTPLHTIADALGEEFRYHPLTYYAAIHLSTASKAADPSSFDVLTQDWSVGADWLFEPSIVDTIKKLVRAYPQTIDREVVGTGGDDVSLREWAKRRFLKAYGWREGVTTDGWLTVHRIGSPDIEDYDSAQGNTIEPKQSEILRYETGHGSTADVVKVTFGNTDITDGRTLFLTAKDNTGTRPGEVGSEPDVEIDLGTVSPPAQQNQAGSSRFAEFRRKTVDRLLLQHFAIPRLTVLAEDHVDESKDYGLGEVVTVGDLNVEPEWLVAQGERVSTLDDQERFTGFLIGRRFFLAEDPDKSLSYELTMLFVGNKITRWRAWSGVIQSVTTTGGNHVLTLGGEGTGDAGKSAFGAELDDGTVAADAEFATVGDEVEIYNPDGTYWANNTPLEITAVDTGTNTITLDGAWSTDPPPDRIVRPAFPDTDDSGTGYNNDGLDGQFANVSRVYVYLAESDDTAGDNEIEADEYGV